MKTIKILGTGCKKCNQLESAVRIAAAQLGEEYEVIKVDRMEDIMKYNIMSTPGLVLNEKIISAGKIHSVDELMKILKND